MERCNFCKIKKQKPALLTRTFINITMEAQCERNYCMKRAEAGRIGPKQVALIGRSDITSSCLGLSSRNWPLPGDLLRIFRKQKADMQSARFGPLWPALARFGPLQPALNSLRPASARFGLLRPALGPLRPASARFGPLRPIFGPCNATSMHSGPLRPALTC